MKKLKLFLVTIMLMAVLSLVGCSQYVSRNFGGDYTHELPKGEKLINATWNEGNLWYLTRPMNEEDSVETYTLEADTLFGVFEGAVTIVESK